MGGVGGAGPGEGLRQELVDAADFGGFVGGGVASLIVGLVPDVPAEDAVVVGEGADDAGDVGLELGLVGGVEQALLAGALDPAGVVDAGDGRVLRAEVRVGLPAGVEEDEQGADVVLLARW